MLSSSVNEANAHQGLNNVCVHKAIRRLIDRVQDRDLRGLTAFSLFVSSSTPQTDAVRTVFSMNVP